MGLSKVKNDLFIFRMLAAMLVGIASFSPVVARAQAWPEDARNITIEDFAERSGELWTCDLHSGHEVFEDLGREYYFENTDDLNSDGTIAGILHSVTLDQGTLIAQGFSFRDIRKGAVFLRRDYVMDDGVDFPQFVGDSVSIPMKVGPDGKHMYPGTFKVVEEEFVVAILDCVYESDGKPDWVKKD